MLATEIKSLDFIIAQARQSKDVQAVVPWRYPTSCWVGTISSSTNLYQLSYRYLLLSCFLYQLSHHPSFILYTVSLLSIHIHISSSLHMTFQPTHWYVRTTLTFSGAVATFKLPLICLVIFLLLVLSPFRILLKTDMQ